MTPTLLAGVDVGGTKIAAGLCDAAGRVIASDRVDTPREGGDCVTARVIALLRELIASARAEVAGVGICVPAVIDQPGGLVLWAPNIAGWQQATPLAAPISEALGAPASLHYDGHAWVTGEWWLGAGRGAQTVALIAVGTGIGGGLIVDGRLHRGRAGVAGAIGWWLLDPAGVAPSRRGPDGWLESIAAGPAIARAAGQPTAADALRAARAGDRAARQAMSRAAEVLGLAAANLASALDPDVIVFAGGVVAGGADLLLPRIREIVASEAQPQIAQGLRLVSAELGEDAAWLGAARLAADRIGEETA